MRLVCAVAAAILAACGSGPKPVDTLSGYPAVMDWHDPGNGKSLVLVATSTYYYGTAPYEVANVELALRDAGAPVKSRWLKRDEFEQYRATRLGGFLRDGKLYDQQPVTRMIADFRHIAVFEVDLPLDKVIKLLQLDRADGQEAFELRITSTDGRLSVLVPETIRR
jgi:hypothetical protein